MPATRVKPTKSIEKSPTGVAGLDEITNGGLPHGRPTLVCGGPGCGKTVLGMEFLVRGATQYDEPGVFMAFEETTRELNENFASMNFAISSLCAQKKLYVEHVRVERNEIEETGEYDLEGLFIRLQRAIDQVGAKRLVLDTIECLFAGFRDINLLRSELRRLFRWLKEKEVTAIVTAETGEGHLTRQGLEEYVADCVIFLDHRVADQNSIRRMRVVKYRGSLHGTSEYPFLIGSEGFSVLPLSSLRLNHKAGYQRISSGIPALDSMLGGKGFFRGSSILVSGAAGTGKSSLAAHFVQAACQRGEQCVYFASEQSPQEITRNMRSIGIDFERWVRKELLHFHSVRAGFCGLEKHLVMMNEEIRKFSPNVVVVDPMTNYGSIGDADEVKSMMTRLVDLFKSQQITAMFTSLTSAGHSVEDSIVGVSSLIDTWLLLRNLEAGGERNRGLYILKSRGMAHSNQIREFQLTDNGARLVDVYVGPEGVLTGSARAAQEARDRAVSQEQKQAVERKHVDLENKRRQLEAQICEMRAKFEAEERDLTRSMARLQARDEQTASDRVHMAHLRQQAGAAVRGNGRLLKEAV